MYLLTRLRVCTILPLVGGCGGGFELPPQVASSQHIAYRTDTDASVICMDDLLAREDAFIKRTALLLGVDVPPTPIDFIWDPIMDGSEPWACPRTSDCYQSREEDELSVVVSTTLTNHHELVHAVEIKGIGANGHPTLKEGLAEYLGTLKSTPPREDFSEAFRAMLAAAPTPDNYNLAMHFVGSIFARHGAEEYRTLRDEMPPNANLEKFSEVFEKSMARL